MHRMHHLAMSVSKASEYSLPQMRVLMLVRLRGKMTISELMQYLNTAQSTASEMVERLVQQEMLIRSKDEHDRRRTVFRLSGKAEALLNQQTQAMQQVYQNLLSPFSDADQERLVKAFETIHELLSGQEAISPNDQR